MKFGLKDKTIEQINRIFSKYVQVESVILYGSRAKGNYNYGSDVDLVLKGNNLDIKLVSKISSEIDDLLLPYSFDISIYRQINNADLIKHINRVGVAFYNKMR